MNSAGPRVAISGLGSIGRQHLGAFLSLDRIGSLVCYDAVPAMRTMIAESHPDVMVVDEFDDLLATAPDAVVIATSDDAHLPQLEAAAATGAAVLVEKPLAPTVADATPVVDRLAPYADRCLVGYVLRHNATAQRIAELVRDEVLGQVTSFQVMLGAYGTITVAAHRFAQPAPDRLYRDYSHEWDYLAWYFGPIARAFAVARTIERLPHVERPNVVDALVETTSGLVGAVHLDYADQRGLRQLSVIGTEGSLVADIGAGTIDLRRVGIPGVERTSAPAGPRPALTDQAIHLLAVARGEVRPAVTLADGLAALAVAEAVRDSAAVGQWVDCGR